MALALKQEQLRQDAAGAMSAGTARAEG